jgi:hypothetical protein
MSFLFHQIEYVNVKDLIPATWDNWFWDMIRESEDNLYSFPFTSFVKPSPFSLHVKRRMEETGGCNEDTSEFFKSLDLLIEFECWICLDDEDSNLPELD